MEQLDVQVNTDQWLEARKRYHTASEASIVLGISPFTTIENFKLIKAGLKTQFYSKAMQLGHELEEQVRQHANDHFDLEFKEEVWVNGEFLASLDGIDGDILVEIKVSDYSYNELAGGEVPANYYSQIQQQLHCSPATKGYLYVYSPKKDKYIVSHEIEEDPKFMATVAAAWVAFDASDNGEVVKLFKDYELLKSEADRIKDDMDEIKKALISRANDKGLQAGKYKLTARAGAKSYNYKQAATDAKLDLTPYEKIGAASYTVTLPKSPFASV